MNFQIQNGQKSQKMKKIFIYSLFFLFCISTDAQDVIKIWKNTAVHSNWSELTVYQPDSAKNNHTAIIVCPGGSYHHLGMKHEGHEVAKMFAKEGFTAFVLRYRVGFFGNHHPDMIEDVQRSIQLVKENAGKYNINEDNVGLIGFSAGGHLVGSAATFYNEDYLAPHGIRSKVSLKPLFTVMMYPVVTMYEPYGPVRSRENLIGKEASDSLRTKMSLERSVHPEMSNILIIQAEDDDVVNFHNATLLNDALTKGHISHQLILHQTGGHGFGAFPAQDKEMSHWFDEVLNWLKTNQIIQ